MLKQFRIDGAVLKVGEGVQLQLSKAQADSRRGRLEAIGADMYRATAQLEFKSGEVLGIALDDVIKAQRASLIDLDAPAVEAAAVEARAPAKKKGQI